MVACLARILAAALALVAAALSLMVASLALKDASLALKDAPEQWRTGFRLFLKHSPLSVYIPPTS